MSVLIKGIKMPKDKPLRIVLNPNGQLFVDHGITFTEYEAVKLPDHGDLIDRDALMAHTGSAYDIDGHELYAVGTGTILRMPAVIPAERSEDGET